MTVVMVHVGVANSGHWQKAYHNRPGGRLHPIGHGVEDPEHFRGYLVGFLVAVD